MDKRKLSAVARAEVTEEMIDIAPRLAGIETIVTAQMIFDDQILLLNFFKIADIKKEKTDAAFRTFLSKDDYITQDLRTEKTKWRTSSFENMNDFRVRTYEWVKDHGEFKYKVFINSTADEEIIREFFKEYKRDSDESVWQSVYRFQDEVKSIRLQAKRKKELDPIDRLMERVKEPPKEFFDYARNEAMAFSRYVIYQEIRKGVAECFCTHCKKTYEVNRKDVHMRNNEKGTCPECGSKVTFKAKGKLPYRFSDERWVVYVEPWEDGFLWRYFHFIRTFERNALVSSQKVEDYIKEYSRAFYTFDGNKPMCKSYEYRVYKQKGPLRWCPDNDEIRCGLCTLYPGNLPQAWEHTPMKYSALEVLARNEPTKALHYEWGIGAYLDFCKLEWICKMGLNKLAENIINEKWSYHYRNQEVLNKKGSTIYDILKLNKVNTKVLQAIDGGANELILLQVAQEIGFQFKPEQLKAYYETFGCNIDLMRQTNRKASLHKIVKYIAKESERYPRAEKIYCWQSYRYNERTDPCIERKQNMAKDWLEYLKWCAELKYDLNNMFIYMPNNFKAVHDRTADEYRAMQDRKKAAEKRKQELKTKRELAKTKKAMEEIFAKNKDTDAFSIKGKGLILIVPQTGEEIKREGAELHHCVGNYVARVAAGETSIFFIRKVEEPDKPYYTMEWNNNKIVQCRGFKNCEMTPEVKAFTHVFEKKMLESIDEKVS